MSGKIITFYSYQGGVGRSMALANVACLLAQKSRVLVIDWDLNAPGLHHYFHDYLADSELERTHGLVDMVFDYACTPITTLPNFQMVTDACRFTQQINLPKTWGQGGHLSLLGAGQQTPNYARFVRGIDWPLFHEGSLGEEFIDAFREMLKTQYDYILIDSSSGIGSASGICTIQMPDLVVAGFTYNRQSVLGLKSVAQSIRSQNEKITLMPVAMRELDGVSGLKEARDFAWGQLAQFVPVKSEIAMSVYCAQSVVYHHHSSALLERLAVLHDGLTEPNCMRQDVAALKDRIIEVIGE